MFLGLLLVAVCLTPPALGAEPYLGEIRLFAGNFPPVGWAFCDGQHLQISENDALFLLIGTIYGGDGQTTFALPDLRGRIPLHQGAGRVFGETGGVEEVTLTTQQIPPHTHPLLCSDAASTGTAAGANGCAGNVVASTATVKAFASAETTTNAAMSAQALGTTGGSQPHENMPPFLVRVFSLIHRSENSDNHVHELTIAYGVL